jgi:hypothetical protein
VHSDDNPVETIEQFFGGKPIATNAMGGKQSALERRFDLISPIAMQRLAHVLWYGAQRYGDDNWRGITADDHLNHAIDHVYEFLAGDNLEDHLGHAFCRIMMALDIAETGVVVQGEDEGESLYSHKEIEVAVAGALGTKHPAFQTIMELLDREGD